VIARAAAVTLLAAAVLAATAQATPPTVRYDISGPPGQNGWFVGPVKVKWTVEGEDASSGCDTRTLTDDTTGLQLTCTATNADGSFPTSTPLIRIDQTPPAGVRPTAARAPDAGGWYTAPVGIGWGATDATSGLAGCTSLTYAGPDGAPVAPTGTCTDRAGNVSAPVPFPMNYDATAPSLTGVTAAASGTTATVGWTPGPDVASTTVTRQPGGPVDVAPGVSRLTDTGLAPGTTYTWSITVRDAAGNATTATAAATVPAVATAAAKGGTSASGTRAVHWKAARGADYYNIQILRNGHKILSAWPRKAHYTLRRTWRYRGKTYKLTAGVYRFYVWPGYGPRARHRYGRLLTHGTVTVRGA